MSEFIFKIFLKILYSKLSINKMIGFTLELTNDCYLTLSSSGSIQTAIHSNNNNSLIEVSQS